MQKIICKNYEEMSIKAADFIKAQVLLKPDAVLGLATGSTPVRMYKELLNKNIDFSNVTTFNLDEYYPIKKDNNQSYDYFMRKNLIDYITLKRFNIPDGEASDPAAECKSYDERIKAAGGIDLQVLGIGVNGHIGFNEPAEELSSGTHMVELTESTIKANARFFDSADDVPKHAITLGLSGIMNAKKILLLISGKNKAEIVRKLFCGGVTTNIPATFLQLHPDVTVIMDEEAASLL